LGREMGEEDAPPAVETEKSPAPAEGAPAADDPPPSPPVEAEETPAPADDAPGPSEDSRVDGGVVARGPRTGSRHDAGAGAEDLVDCTFVVLPERFEHSATIPATEPFASVKSMLASALPIPLDAVMTLRQPDGGEPLPDDACLADYGVGAADEVELELIVAYRTEREMRAEAEENARREAEDFARLEEEAAAAAAAEAAQLAEEARLADTDRPSLPETLRVTVRGARRGEPSRVVTVRIDASGCVKPRYLGGFRDRRDGTVYHHASNQTIPTKPRVWKTKFTTETQTMQGRSRLAQTRAEASTQMARKDLVMDESRDVEVWTGKYVTHAEVMIIKERHTLTLQKYFRGMRARRLANELRVRRDDAVRRAEEDEAVRTRAEERRRRFETERRIRPKTSEDFELLYGELEQWRVRETAEVEAEFPPKTDARRLAMSRLLAKETELIRTIGRLRIAANNANRERRVERALEDMSQTKRWERKDGSLVEVDTPFTVRARELARLYDALRLETRRDVSTDERLDVLVHVKWTVKEFDCGLTREIVELADREADLLNRGRDPAAMTGLRRRIANLFLQFIETPEFNPESARYSVTNVVNGMETDDGMTLQEAAMLSATQKFSRPIRNR
jgi:hypothetical protein